MDDRSMIILLTGTIVPNTILKKHLDPIKRRKEYINAIKNYTKFGKVVFLENSTHDLLNDSEFLEIENLELVKFPVSDFVTKGSGYQEFYMIDEWVKKQNENIKFIKITGRYTYHKFDCLFTECLNNSENIALFERTKNPKVNCRTDIFCCSIEFYKSNLIGLYSLSNDSNGVFIEHIFAQKLINNESTKLFRNYPIALGTEGSNNIPMKITAKKIFKKYAYNILYLINNKFRIKL